MGIQSWWKRRRLHLDEQDFQDEIRAHLAIATEERMADGADARIARDASIKEFGNVTLTTEAARRVWTPHWQESLRDLVNDTHYAVRALAKDAAFTLAVIGVLTLGIGLNAAVFTMLKAIAISPIAGVERSARLAVIHAETSSGRKLRVSYADYRYLRDSSQAFTGLFGSVVATVGLGNGRGARSLWGEIVTGNYFEILGVRAQLGRLLMPSDEATPGRNPVVVLSDGLWRRDFGAATDIVGRAIKINGYPLTVVGVADASFHGTTVVYDVDVYVPVTMAPLLGFAFGSQQTSPEGILADRRLALFYPEGYLRPGTTLSSAAAEIGALWTTRARERALVEESLIMRIVPFWETPSSAPSILLPTLTVLTAMGLLVLLIACANIAGLVLVRGLSRRGEIAVRLALGATRGRIVRLLVVENLVLALPGAVLGVLLASNGIAVLVSYAEALAAPQRAFFNIDVDGGVIGFSVLVACACSLVFGLVPALQSSRVDQMSVIHEEASPRGAARGRLRAGLVVAQVAVSLLLLVESGLMARSLDAARHADPGFDASRVTSTSIDLKQNGYDEFRGRVFYTRLLDEARATAGTASATLGANEPMAFLETPARRVAIQGYEPRTGEELAFLFNIVGPDYFQTLRIGVVAGREFEVRDDHTAAPVIIVNRTFADRFLGGPEDAIGKRVRVADGEWRTVVGVAADVKYLRINESPRPYVYLPFFQSYRSAMILHAATSAAPGGVPIDTLVETSRALVVRLDGDLPILYARDLASQLDGALLLLNLMASMLFIFGATGIALAAMGTYGLVAYTVRQSTREIGIRMALGASAFGVVREFLLRGLRVGAVGAALGIVAALGIGRLLQGVLVGVSATDAGAFGSALAIVLGVVTVATLVPARRASRADPLGALRHQ